ncbi:MAG: hypothetical protein RLZZ292_2497 [Bacteroidota bacterium]
MPAWVRKRKKEYSMERKIQKRKKENSRNSRNSKIQKFKKFKKFKNSRNSRIQKFKKFKNSRNSRNSRIQEIQNFKNSRNSKIHYSNTKQPSSTISLPSQYIDNPTTYHQQRYFCSQQCAIRVPLGSSLSVRSWAVRRQYFSF